ncbi:MAG TPA: hypothetical protein VGG19_15450 [Tepidisphaeraceae bacterium]|jgi:hypothetical protein
MQHKRTVSDLFLLASLLAGGCQVNQRTADTATTQPERETLISVNQLPPDVVRTVHQHLSKSSIVEAEDVNFRGRMAYKLYVKWENGVYVMKIRPDGTFLWMGKYDEVNTKPRETTLYR